MVFNPLFKNRKKVLFFIPSLKMLTNEFYIFLEWNILYLWFWCYGVIFHFYSSFISRHFFLDISLTLVFMFSQDHTCNIDSTLSTVSIIPLISCIFHANMRFLPLNFRISNHGIFPQLWVDMHIVYLILGKHTENTSSIQREANNIGGIQFQGTE